VAIFACKIVQQQHPFYTHYTQPTLAGTPSEELEDFLLKHIFCLHALANGT